MRSHRNRGFTLVELLVVLGIVLIMTAVAIASFSGVGTPKQQLRHEARDVIGLLNAARLAAMERKLKVDVYVDPEARSVCAVEAGYARRLLAANGRFFSDGASLAAFAPETNRYFRVTVFPEPLGVEAFALQDIEAAAAGEDPPYEPAREEERPLPTSGRSRPAFSFGQLGGASGGGISVIRDGLRLDVACDVLTGQPELVRRRTEP